MINLDNETDQKAILKKKTLSDYYRSNFTQKVEKMLLR